MDTKHVTNNAFIMLLLLLVFDSAPEILLATACCHQEFIVHTYNLHSISQDVCMHESTRLSLPHGPNNPIIYPDHALALTHLISKHTHLSILHPKVQGFHKYGWRKQHSSKVHKIFMIDWSNDCADLLLYNIYSQAIQLYLLPGTLQIHYSAWGHS